MILINTTFAVEPSILDEFIEWVSKDLRHEAEKIVEGKHFLLTHILKQEGEDGGMKNAVELTYAFQFRVKSIERAQRWMGFLSTIILGDAMKRWGAKLLHFTTLMNVVPLD